MGDYYRLIHATATSFNDHYVLITPADVALKNKTVYYDFEMMQQGANREMKFLLQMKPKTEFTSVPQIYFEIFVRMCS